MSDFNKKEIKELNSKLSDALDENVENDVFLAASKITEFWGIYLYDDAALDKAQFELLKELNELEAIPLWRALAVNRIVNSDFWDGNLENLSKIPDRYKPQILEAAKYIHKTSQTDAEFFGETS